MYIIIILFSLVAFLFMLQIYLLNVDLDNIYEYIIEQKVSGNFELPWFGQNPVWAASAATILGLLSTLGGYIGCIVFFIYLRSHGSSD